MFGVSAYGVLAYGASPAAVAVTALTPGNVMLLSPRDSDAATFTASSERADLGVTNLQQKQPTKKWRSADATPQYIDVDFGTPVAANAMALVAHNLTQAGMIRVRLASTEADVTASPAVDTTLVSAWPLANKPTAPDWPAFTSMLTWDNDSAYQYARVDISDGGVVLTYLEAGRLVLGRAWQPSFNFDLGGSPLGFDTADVQTKTPFGRTFTDRRTTSPPRLFEVTFYALTKREAFDGIYELQRLLGMWGDVICMLDPGESDDAHRFIMQGVFTDRGAYSLPAAFDSDGNMYGAGIRLRELL